MTIQLPSGATMERTQEVENQVLEILQKEDDVTDVIMISGFNFISGITQTNSAFFVVTLTNWDERPDPDQNAMAMVNRLLPEFLSIPQAMVMAFNPPAITGLGSVGGFQMQLQDIDSLVDALAETTRKFIGRSMMTPYIGRLSTTFRNDVPQLYLDIDRTKAELYGVDIGSLLDTLQFYMGSFYVNDFNKYGKVYQVILQADAPYRMEAEEIVELHVQNRDGDMIPLAAFLEVESISGVDNLPHYNIYNSVSLNGTPGPGYSSGIAIKAMEKISEKVLPEGMTTEWTGLTYQQLKAGNLGHWYSPWHSSRCSCSWRPSTKAGHCPSSFFWRYHQPCWARCCSCCSDSCRSTSTGRSGWSCSSALPRRTRFFLSSSPRSNAMPVRRSSKQP